MDMWQHQSARRLLQLDKSQTQPLIRVEAKHKANSIFAKGNGNGGQASHGDESV